MKKFVTFEGRVYEVDLAPDAPAHTVKIFRMKKDATRGLQVKGCSRVDKIYRLAREG